MTRKVNPLIPSFTIKKRVVLAEQVANQLRIAIRSGKLTPGKRLFEAALADNMEVSRSAVREAIRYLEKEGLVTAKPFKGTYVTELGEKDLEEIYVLRPELEQLAIRLLVKNLNDDKIRNLELIVEEMKRVADNPKSVSQVIEVDLRFHQRICELSGNHRLLQAWLTISYQLSAFIAMDDQLYGDETPAQVFKRHYVIFESIKKGNAELAMRQMKKVIESGYKNALKHATIKTTQNA